MKLTDAAGLVREFMVNFDQKMYPRAEQTPCEVALLRASLIEEEINEYANSPFYSEPELDALCDMLYVTLGTNLALGVKVDDIPLLSRRGQIRHDKKDFFIMSRRLVQDLKCRFPCHKTQEEELSRINAFIVFTAWETGYDFGPAFREVHKANMGKLWTVDDPVNILAKGYYQISIKPGGTLVKDSQGKVVKPPSFTPPNLRPYL